MCGIGRRLQFVADDQGVLFFRTQNSKLRTQNLELRTLFAAILAQKNPYITIITKHMEGTI